jgi:hypothetical protein
VLDAETVAHIAEDKARLIAAAHAAECPSLGRIEKRLERVELMQLKHEAYVQKIAGALGLSKVLVPISAAVAIFATLWRIVMDLRGNR